METRNNVWVDMFSVCNNIQTLYKYINIHVQNTLEFFIWFELYDKVLPI